MGTTTTALSTFAFNDTTIRVVEIGGQPWFVACVRRTHTAPRA